jgi:hypothetical protein
MAVKMAKVMNIIMCEMNNNENNNGMVIIIMIM